MTSLPPSTAPDAQPKPPADRKPSPHTHQHPSEEPPPPADRSRHPRRPILVHHNASIPSVTLQPNHIRRSPQHHNHRPNPASLATRPPAPAASPHPTEPAASAQPSREELPAASTTAATPHRHTAPADTAKPRPHTSAAPHPPPSAAAKPPASPDKRLRLRNHRQRNRLRPIPTQVQPHRSIDPLATLRHTSPNHRRRLAHQQ